MISLKHILVFGAIFLVSLRLLSQSWTCGDDFIDSRDGRSYRTVAIGDQCWFAENINIGTMIHGDSSLADNGVIEKFCYENDSMNCAIYGGMYNWYELMDWDTIAGTQGICPTAWHIPTDNEYYVLESFLDTTITDSTAFGARGTDGGLKMKMGGVSAFDVLLAGSHYELSHGFIRLGITGGFNSSTEYQSHNGIGRGFLDELEQVDRATKMKHHAYSVRCLLDTPITSCYPKPKDAIAGMDQILLKGISVKLGANQPGNTSGKWMISSGSGGSFFNDSLSNTVFQGQQGEVYHLVWSLSNSCGVSRDTIRISFAADTSTDFVCKDTLVDPRDGKIYKVVKIGNQCWMAENLNVGSLIMSNSGADNQTNDSIIEKFCYRNKVKFCDLYGGFYQWDELMQYNTASGQQGICPAGWFVPSYDDFGELIALAGGEKEAAKYLMDSSSQFWIGDHIVPDKRSGFEAVGAGYRHYQNGMTNFEGKVALFWTSDATSPQHAWRIGLSSNAGFIYRLSSLKTNGLSVRCMQLPCNPMPTKSNAGSDMLLIPTDSIQLSANQAITGNGQWNVLAGQGGYILNDTLPDAYFWGQAGQTYTLEWTISTSCGTSRDTVMLHFDMVSFQCGDTLIDPRDGRPYQTVQIGNQYWMSENLNFGQIVNSVDTIPAPHSEQSNNGIAEKYCFKNIPVLCDFFGGLYNWDELMDYTTTEGSQGICPPGWHVPTDYEWYLLESEVDTTMNNPSAVGWRGTDIGTSLKENGSSGFEAVPGGVRTATGSFRQANRSAMFWTSTPLDTNRMWYRQLHVNKTSSFRKLAGKHEGFSVRCIYNTLVASSKFKLKQISENFLKVNLKQNPVKNKCIVSLVVKKPQWVNISIFSSDAQLQYETRKQFLSGKIKININTRNWSKGVYFIHCTSQSNKVIKKLLVI